MLSLTTEHSTYAAKDMHILTENEGKIKKKHYYFHLIIIASNWSWKLCFKFILTPKERENTSLLPLSERIRMLSDLPTGNTKY